MPEVLSYSPGTPSWVDLGTPDPAAARDFYGLLFGWQFDTNEEFGYTTASRKGRKVAGMVARPIDEPAWTTYFATDDAPKVAELVTSNGGALTVAPIPVGRLGTMLVWQDPTGAVAGAWQAEAMTGAQLVNETSALVWTELNTRDLDAAAAFYSAILPVTAQDLSKGDFGYQTLQVQGRDVAGMWQMSADVPADVAPNWAVYFGVDDTDLVVAAATRLGATLTAPAKDTPYGRFAGFTDPQGAAFYVIKTTPDE